MTRLEGTIRDITFQNEDNGFTVLQLQVESKVLPCTCVGVMPTVVKGATIGVQGEWESHKKFGNQFAVKHYEIIRPTTVKGIEQLLGSGLIPNIGAVRARMIIDKFGISTLDILDKEPDRLLEVSGIGKKTLIKIKDAWNHQKHIRDLMIFLQEFDVSLNMAAKIFKAYGQEAKNRISEDPYALIDDVWGVGFIKADRIAQKLGFEQNSYKRIRAGLTYILQEAASDGHTFLPVEELIAKTVDLLKVSAEHVTFSLDHSVQAKLLLREDEAVYLPQYFYSERNVARMLREKITGAGKSGLFTREEIESWMAGYRIRTGWQGDPKQNVAICEALLNPLFLLTGGPGTGKTTILQVIVSFLREHHRTVSLAAPTGRAAQRMGSISGLKARTIHRLLEFKPGGDGYTFSRNEENPIEADVILLDEVSMVDLVLMKHFLSAVSEGTRVVFVGDDNQLPSVGAGNVLADLIASRMIPHVHLTAVFRQAARSRIITAAHEIIQGAVPIFTNNKDDNCFFITEDDPEKCLDTIVDLTSRRLPARYGYDPVSDIQVLAPMHKGILGTQNINVLLQSRLNKSTQKIMRGQMSYCLGDKVMQVKNNYDLGVFNGDIGIVSVIYEDTGVSVDYDGNTVTYDLKYLDEIQPAYCISIHKSQGCEFKAVVIAITTQHFIMLQRNLIYTALTRARELCIFIGTSRALAIAVRNNEALRRYSRLSMHLTAGIKSTF